MKFILTTILGLAKLSILVQSKKHNDCFNEVTKGCNCVVKMEASDTIKLKKLTFGFYRNDSGHLYDMTLRFVENARDKLVPYLNGCVQQDLDVETLVSIDSSWYLKDKNNYYYTQPTSGGLIYINITKNVDSATFKVQNTKMDFYALDKNYLYEGASVVLKRKHGRIYFFKNKEGEIIKFIQGKKIISCE